MTPDRLIPWTDVSAWEQARVIDVTIQQFLFYVSTVTGIRNNRVRTSSTDLHLGKSPEPGKNKRR